MDIEKELELSSYDGEDKVISSHEVEEKIKTQPKATYHFDSKIPGLDKLINGFEAGELIIISGPTKNGKTAFSQSLTVNFERQGIKCLWFEFEVPERQFIAQFKKELPLFYLPKILKDKDVNWIKNRILEGIIKYNTRVVFIDHLHYLIDMYTKNASMDIGRAIRDLKRFAVENDVVIFTMAHTTKIKPGMALTEDSVRDSSFIPQEADSTIMIQRESKIRIKGGQQYIEYTGNTFLHILNHRRTGVMGKKINLLFKDGYLYEKDISGRDDSGIEIDTENQGLDFL